MRKIGVNVNATGAADFGMGIVFRKELGKGKGLGEFNMDIELLFIVDCICPVELEDIKTTKYLPTTSTSSINGL